MSRWRFEELQELAIVTRKNAEHANAARGLNEAVGKRELGEAMQRIEASSSAIASIVAQEVRSLSTRSAEAAPSTARLIEEARKHAEAAARRRRAYSRGDGVGQSCDAECGRQLRGISGGCRGASESGGGDAIACQLIPTEWTGRAPVAS